MYLYDIYRDFSPKQVIYKAAQIGFSTLAVFKTFWIAKNLGIDIIYTLPTVTDVYDFVGSKTNRIIAQNPILQKWTKDRDTVEQKEVGNNIIYTRGTFTQKQAQMVSSDLNCFKEGTEVLTKEGWKNVEDIELDDLIATYNKGYIEWHKPDFLIVKESQELLEFKNSVFSLSVTPNHNMFVERRGGWALEKAESLILKGKFSFGIAKTKLKQRSGEVIQLNESIEKRPQGSCLLPKRRFDYKDKFDKKTFYQFLGWYLAEGNVGKVRGRLTGRVVITQKKERYKKDIEAVLDNLGVTWGYSGGSYSFSNWAIAIYMNRLGYSHDKYIPQEILLDTKYLTDLLDALYDGDAFQNKHTRYLNTASKKLADNVQTAWLFLGKMSSITTVKDRTCRMYRVGVRRHQKIQFNVYKSRKKSGYIERREKREDVYCFSVKNHIVYVRNGKIKVPVLSGQCYDEVDSSNQMVVDQYSTRLQASSYKWEWYFSHPSIPGNGVAKYWHKSDQKHWFIKCDEGHLQYISWPESFDMKRKIYQCRECGIEITNKNRRAGKWVKKVKDAEFSGYWIPLFLSTKVSAEEIIGYHNDKSEEYFYNKVLGLPHATSDAIVTQDTLWQNLTPQVNQRDKRTVIGVDTGLGIHLVAGNADGLFYYSSTEDYIDFERLMNDDKEAIAVFDAQGDLQRPRELQEKYPRRIYLCYYRNDTKSGQLVRWMDNESKGIVHVDRNRMIDFVIDNFKSKRMPLQGTVDDWLDYWKHWSNIYREDIENHLGVKVRRWKRNGRDDLVHATNYFYAGLNRFKGAKGGIIGGSKTGLPTSPTVNPDQTIDFNPIKNQWK